VSTALAVPPPFPLEAVNPHRGRRLPWPQLLLWSVTLTLATALVMVYRGPREPSLGMSVNERDGQLVIAWKPATNVTLQILDGPWSTSLNIPPQLSGLTYARRTSDVSVLLVAGPDQKLARFVSREAGTPAELSDQMRALSDQARSARFETESGLWRITQLQSTANKIVGELPSAEIPSAKAPAKVAPRKRPVMSWWR